MSAYNGESYILEQLDSIYNQKGVNVSLVVRDDGSMDSTYFILCDYKNTHPDFNMRILKGQNIGYVKSFYELTFFALDNYQDCYFAFSDHDDVWLEDKLAVAISSLQTMAQKDGSPLLYCSNAMMVDVNLREIGLFREDSPIISAKRSLIHNIVTGCTAVFNRRAAELFVYRQIESITVHDQFLYIICTLLGDVIYDNTPHILYRQHGKNQIGKPSRVATLSVSLKKLFKGTHSLEERAQRILEALEGELPEDKKRIVREVAMYRHSLKNRLKLFMDKEFRYPSALSNFLFRCKILIGRI